jgi:N6-adenosine-specific RNA methylase IME4
VADPPWHYDNRAQDVTHRGRLPYQSMTLDDIRALPVEEQAEDDAALWLWTTNAHMEFAWDVARGWGFKPKTVLTWAKDRMGLGDWLRGQTEHCLLAVRGRPEWRLTNETTLLRARRTEHSRKPDTFYEMVERMSPGPWLELFARRRRFGWDVWGNEAPEDATSQAVLDLEGIA